MVTMHPNELLAYKVGFEAGKDQAERDIAAKDKQILELNCALSRCRTFLINESGRWKNFNSGDITKHCLDLANSLGDLTQSLAFVRREATLALLKELIEWREASRCYPCGSMWDNEVCHRMEAIKAEKQTT